MGYAIGQEAVDELGTPYSVEATGGKVVVWAEPTRQLLRLSPAAARRLAEELNMHADYYEADDDV